MALDLLEPTVADRPPAIASAPRLANVRGKRLGFVDNSKCNADLFIRRLCNQFGDRFAVVPGPIVRKLAPKDRLTEADLSRLSQCDAVILCFGDCGTSTSINVTDAVEIERRGIPTVNVFSTAFAEAARKHAEGRGLSDLPLVKIPHPMHTAPHKAVTERADAVIDALVERLTTRTKISPEAKKLHRFEGANDNDDHEMLFARGWTDGLPVVFPTLNKVAAMVAASGRDAHEQIGPVPPCWRHATIEKIAINAVMAGCKPDYFPVVLTAIEALLDSDCQLYGIQTATNTAAPLLIVNGPIVGQLGINARGNVFGQGVRANATIGRAVQLVLRNIGGDIAGETDMATHGQAGKFSSCIAEAEADSPWTSLHIDAGFDAADSTVTVIGASAPHNVFTYGCNTGEDILEHFVGAATALGHNNIIFPTGPLFIVSPEHAGTLTRDGIGKTDMRNAIFERARIPLSRFAKRSVEGLRHRRSRWFAEVGDPDHIGVADRPEDINIVVAGGAGIHSLFVPTAFSYRAVTRRIVCPADQRPTRQDGQTAGRR